MTAQGDKPEEQGFTDVVIRGLTDLRDRFRGIFPGVNEKITLLDLNFPDTLDTLSDEENIRILSGESQIKIVFETGPRPGFTAMFDLHFPTEDELAMADQLGNQGTASTGFKESFLLNAIKLIEDSPGDVGLRTGYLIGKKSDSGITVITGMILGAIAPQGRTRLSNYDRESMLGLVREWYPEVPEYTIVGTLNDVMLHLGTQNLDHTVDVTKEDIDYVGNERPMPHLFYQSGRQDPQLLTVLELASDKRSVVPQGRVLCIRRNTEKPSRIELDNHIPLHRAIGTIEL